ncbi:TonB-dependent receptor plug domain-containing protein [Xanthomonas floridensis]|nr:Plug domain-containing protein [Xanthomonas floridensis]MEA5131445.1 TonB-dependent receptor plug domain-containing protein [Xanthomonas floridensis]
MKTTLGCLLMAGAVQHAAAQDATQLPAVQVIGDYAADKANSTTQAEIALADYPASIQVVPSEVLRDRGVTRTEQLMDNVSGVHAEASYGGNGATFFNIGTRQATLPHTFQLSGDTRTDAMVSYARGPWTTQLNLLNVFDRRFYVGGSAGVFNYPLTPNAPATAQLTLP